MDRAERLHQISVEMKEIIDRQSEISERQRTLGLKSYEYKELEIRYNDLSHKFEKLFLELQEMQEEEFAESHKLMEDIKTKHKELEERGFFEKLNKSSAVLENPDNYTEDEVREAKEFEKGLTEVSIKYAEENSDGLIRIEYEND